MDILYLYLAVLHIYHAILHSCLGDALEDRNDARPYNGFWLLHTANVMNVLLMRVVARQNLQVIAGPYVRVAEYIRAPYCRTSTGPYCRISEDRTGGRQMTVPQDVKKIILQEVKRIVLQDVKRTSCRTTSENHTAGRREDCCTRRQDDRAARHQEDCTAGQQRTVLQDIKRTVLQVIRGPYESRDYSPPPKANRVPFLAGSLPNFSMWESCRTMPLVGEFSRGFPVSPVLFHTHFTSVHSQAEVASEISNEEMTISMDEENDFEFENVDVRDAYFTKNETFWFKNPIVRRRLNAMYRKTEPGKCGIKIWIMADSDTAYCKTLQVYLRKKDGKAEKEQGKRVVLDFELRRQRDKYRVSGAKPASRQSDSGIEAETAAAQWLGERADLTAIPALTEDVSTTTPASWTDDLQTQRDSSHWTADDVAEYSSDAGRRRGETVEVGREVEHSDGNSSASLIKA
ncbi:hypothetical protein PR048_005562 [Dryococelus australis]|uniref:PiggyBac transposable element-derived protein domain-containing protein n=1 Tax=Dryococelus australis TaxID=614101 RepID=A0ABQ9I8Q0_9NEOP|nr:hypothetical protein PR048_005562 [Dryococelus australis]